MANYFDQFDQPATPAAAPASNYFDQFDQPTYRGSVLPFSQDAAGNNRLDWSAGIPGRIINAFRLPGDVANGTQPIFGANGQVDPQLQQRAADFALTMTPTESGSAVPSALDLKNSASALYKGFRNSGLDISGPPVGNLIQGIKQSLESDGIIAEHAPKTFATLNKAIGDIASATSQPGATSVVTPANFQAVRRSLTKVSGDPTDTEAARQAKQALDGYLGGIPPGDILSSPSAGPAAVSDIFRTANANFAAAQRSNDLSGVLDKANTGIAERAEARAAASHSGANIGNSIRQRVESFLEKPNNVAGFSQPEIDALNAVVKGNPIQNGARWVGNYFGGGGGLGSLATTGAGSFLGSQYLGPEGGLIGAMLAPALGITAKQIDNSFTRSRLGDVDEMLRMRSPLYTQGSQYILPPFTPSAAVTRALLPGLLSPYQPAQPATPPQLGLLAAGGA